MRNDKMPNIDDGWRINRKTGGRFNIYIDYEPNKERNIKQSEADGQRLTKESQQVPRRLYLQDIPAETANKTSDILNLRTKQRYRFKNGTKLTRVHVFAGKGCSKEFRDAEKYARRYGGRASDWQHCSGIGYITNGSSLLKCEIHWVQGKDGNLREAFIKEVLS